LDVPRGQKEEEGRWVKEGAELVNARVKNLNVRGSVVDVREGGCVRRFEVDGEAGVKVKKIRKV
uniref:DNA translocase FtsK n=1 Tax=Bacillus sp. WP8 TaxID=756828 RepID=UPI0021B5E9B8